MYKYLLTIIFIVLNIQAIAHPRIIVLGTAQDGGHPHIGCKKKCCEKTWSDAKKKHYVVALALVDPEHKKWWLLEATPDIKEQLQYFKEQTNGAYNYLPDGIFLTHAHMGHYTGLMQLGREALGAKNIPVYAAPKMKAFLENNGPWSQLIQLENIDLKQITPGKDEKLNDHITIQGFTVPHRDEYSETLGFSINTTERGYLFIPDINKWSIWTNSIVEKTKAADIVLLDATFYSNEELPGMRMEEVPHPFVTETMETFKNADAATKAKVYFIHMNHTNPLLWDAATQKKVRSYGYNYAQRGMYL